MTNKKPIRWGVFLVPWLLAVATIILNLVNGEAFNSVIMSVTSFIDQKSPARISFLLWEL